VTPSPKIDCRKFEERNSGTCNRGSIPMTDDTLRVYRILMIRLAKPTAIGSRAISRKPVSAAKGKKKDSEGGGGVSLRPRSWGLNLRGPRTVGPAARLHWGALGDRRGVRESSELQSIRNLHESTRRRDVGLSSLSDFPCSPRPLVQPVPTLDSASRRSLLLLHHHPPHIFSLPSRGVARTPTSRRRTVLYTRILLLAWRAVGMATRAGGRDAGGRGEGGDLESSGYAATAIRSDLPRRVKRHFISGFSSTDQLRLHHVSIVTSDGQMLAGTSDFSLIFLQGGSETHGHFCTIFKQIFFPSFFLFFLFFLQDTSMYYSPRYTLRYELRNRSFPLIFPSRFQEKQFTPAH
jgi:hypothetical protein